MAGKKAVAKEEHEPSRAAGGCVLFLLGCAPVAVVFAVSPTAGILALWAVGALLLWRAVRRRVSDSSATPPPGDTEGVGDVYARETTRVKSAEYSPEGVTFTIHPVIESIAEEVNDS